MTDISINNTFSHGGRFGNKFIYIYGTSNSI